jgi:hypothetical protein
VSFPRLQRRFVALAAVLAISLQAFWPLIAQAQPRAAGELVPVCTVNGITHYIELPVGKTPLEQRSSSHGEHCKLCVSGSERGVALLSLNVAVYSSAKEISEEKFEKVRPLLESRARPPAQPRAPPAVS